MKNFDSDLPGSGKSSQWGSEPGPGTQLGQLRGLTSGNFQPYLMAQAPLPPAPGPGHHLRTWGTSGGSDPTKFHQHLWESGPFESIFGFGTLNFGRLLASHGSGTQKTKNCIFHIFSTP